MVAELHPEQAVLGQKRPTPRIDLALAENIADLVVKYKMTESEACAHLGIKRQTWFNHKCRPRVGSKYDEIINRIRGAQLVNCIGTINKAGETRTVTGRDGKAVEISGDWRAKAWIAERVLAPERFADRQPDQTTTVQVTVALQAATDLYTKLSTAQVVDVQSEPNQITNGTNIK